jgi:hypothetical protein
MKPDQSLDLLRNSLTGQTVHARCHLMRLAPVDAVGQQAAQGGVLVQFGPAGQREAAGIAQRRRERIQQGEPMRAVRECRSMEPDLDGPVLDQVQQRDAVGVARFQHLQEIGVVERLGLGQDGLGVADQETEHQGAGRADRVPLQGFRVVEVGVEANGVECRVVVRLLEGRPHLHGVCIGLGCRVLHLV